MVEKRHEGETQTRKVIEITLSLLRHHGRYLFEFVIFLFFTFRLSPLSTAQARL